MSEAREGALEELVRVLCQAVIFNLAFITNPIQFQPSKGNVLRWPRRGSGKQILRQGQCAGSLCLLRSVLGTSTTMSREGSRSRQRETRFSSGHRTGPALANSVGALQLEWPQSVLLRSKWPGLTLPPPPVTGHGLPLGGGAALGTQLSAAEMIAQETTVLP